ncbi:MAG: hypothetical protein [Wigfec virus K19_83]|nr:MAG: hypothetical protein [Wigfec virus K19_83]
METNTTAEMENKVTPTAKKRNTISKTYTLTQFGEIIKKIKELKWLGEQDLKTIEGLREKCKTEYIKSL